jgi:hypothetical protein
MTGLNSLLWQEFTSVEFKFSLFNSREPGGFLFDYFYKIIKVTEIIVIVVIDRFWEQRQW